MCKRRTKTESATFPREKTAKAARVVGTGPVGFLRRESVRATSRWSLIAASLTSAFLWSCHGVDSGLGPNADSGGKGGSPSSPTVDSGPVNAPNDWCSARKVLQDHCVSCHVLGSPFGSIPLVTIDDVEVTLPSGMHAYESIKQRVHDPVNVMPPTADHLTPVELATIDNWVAAGAKPGSNPSCIPGADDAGADGAGGAGGNGGAGGGGAAGTGGAGGSGGVGDAGLDARDATSDSSDSGSDASRPDGGSDAGVDGGSGGDGGTPPTGWPTDCEQRYTVLAHGVSQPTDKSKFNVSAAGSKDFYECFVFKAPWGTSTVQALRFAPVIDDTRVVSRWALYGLDNSTGSNNGPDGAVGATGCRNGTYLQGWAPGSTETVLPANVGLRMPSGANAYLALEVHYDNTGNYTNAVDASGVEFCVTKTLRANTASVHWLGSTNFSLPARMTTDVTSTCDPTATTPVHLVAIHPQMNRLGINLKLLLNHTAAGGIETLHDSAFDIANQQTYSTKAVVNNGDTLTTTCSYNNTTSTVVGYGDTVADENCYSFVTAYPAGALSAFLTPDRCIGQ